MIIIIIYLVLIYFAYYNEKIMNYKIQLRIIRIFIFFTTRIGYLPLQSKKVIKNF